MLTRDETNTFELYVLEPSGLVTWVEAHMEQLEPGDVVRIRKADGTLQTVKYQGFDGKEIETTVRKIKEFPTIVCRPWEI